MYVYQNTIILAQRYNDIFTALLDLFAITKTIKIYKLHTFDKCTICEVLKLCKSYILQTLTLYSDGDIPSISTDTIIS